MTDTSTSFPVKAIDALASAHALPPSSFPIARHQHYHAPADVDPIEETINCICGYNDDDGWTVACDVCNRWQHQSCYYPQYDESELPSELQHACVECKPRPVDWQRAQQRQREKRAHQEPQTNGVKRTTAKSHKKKVKEPANTYTNGWPVDKLRHDRNSASPRDQQPPTKRPKTSHRSSDSTTTTKGHSRKRNASSATHRRSISRSPDSPIEQYSEQFLECYHKDDWAVTNINLHNSIAITSALSEWLGFSDDEFRDHHNQAKGEVLMRWDGKLDDIPGKAQLDILETRDDSVQYHGEYPTWKLLTVKDSIAEGAYIGELKGHVGFKRDYQSESMNRWAQLRHPEPFVFFHPKLPIYIDARNEGTELRYVRRSCQPNARLQILVTDNVDYHFCFMATTQIDPGMEIAVGWDFNDGLPELTSKSKLSDEELDRFSAWVSTALANYGPCACQLSEHCSLSRFDRRRRGAQDEAQQTKAKSKKRKTNHISPINTTLNSRSGSEARKVDLDEEGTESRSTSGSAGRGSASRDITPNTHYSTNGVSSVLPELSERERKKLAAEEAMFRRQEDERASKQAKKKRPSGAGSNAQTPSETSSKHIGFPSNNSKYVDAGNAKQSGLAPARSMPGRKPRSNRGPGRPSSRNVKRTKPVYVDQEVQCDLDAEEAKHREPTPSPRRPFVTMRQRLLLLCARNNHVVTASRSNIDAAVSKDVSAPVKVDADADAISSRPSSAHMAKAQPADDTSTPHIPSQPTTSHDVDMVDAASTHDQSSSPADARDSANAGRDEDSKVIPAAELITPPCEAATTGQEPTVAHGKHPEMHLQMPPPPANPFGQAGQPMSADTPSSAASLVQSPATFGQTAIFSPSVTAAVAPSPAKKKLSLSDYTRRKAKDKDPEPMKTDRESSPASTNSGPVAPPLRPSSSEEARGVDGGSAIDEDVKMEDAGDTPAIKI